MVVFVPVEAVCGKSDVHKLSFLQLLSHGANLSSSASSSSSSSSAPTSTLQSYQWLKEKIVSEDGRKQQAKLKELGHLTEKLGCTLPQLAVGKDSGLTIHDSRRPWSLLLF